MTKLLRFKKKINSNLRKKPSLNPLEKIVEGYNLKKNKKLNFPKPLIKEEYSYQKMGKIKLKTQIIEKILGLRISIYVEN